MAIQPIICKYAYNGNIQNTSWENRQVFPEEKYEVTPEQTPSGYSLTIKNIDRDIEETFCIEQEVYKKLILATDDQNLCEYITPVYERWQKEGKI